MAFRSRQKMVLLGGWAALENVEERDPDTGVVRIRKYNPSDDVLPPAEKFELETLLKAGVPLQQVRTKILSPDVTPLAEALADAEDSQFESSLQQNNKVQSNKVVTNEQQ